MAKYKRVLAISDTQIPFNHPYALTFLCKLRDQLKPDLVVHVGDETDQAALAKYPKDPNGESAGTELKKARRILKGFYEEFPQVYVCNSNHQQRLYKRAFEAGIPKEYIADIHDYLQAPKGWQWADAWTFDGVVYEHGDRASGISAGVRLVDANHASTVFGHHHSTAGVGYVRKANRTLFYMNTGCLIDETGYGMAYTKMHRTKPILSCGVIIDGVPQLIPMHKGLRLR